MVDAVAVHLAEKLEAIETNFDVPDSIALRVSMLINDVADIRFVDVQIVPDEGIRRGIVHVFTAALVIRADWQDPFRNRPNLELVRIESWARRALSNIAFVTNTKDGANIEADWKEAREPGWPWSGQAILSYESPDVSLRFPLRIGQRSNALQELTNFFPDLLSDLAAFR